MKKEQFWVMIESVDQMGLLDQDAICNQMETDLSRCSLEDILDWHSILNLYWDAADRDDLWRMSEILGAHSTDDGFSDFRSWLISRGREVYRNALRDPKTLATVPRKGEKLNFECFHYVAINAYKMKTHQEGLDMLESFYEALDRHPLSTETEHEVREELEQLQVDRSTQEIELPEAQDMEKLLRTYNQVYGFVERKDGYEEYVFQNTPENIASFIGSRPTAKRITITDPFDRLILNTVGFFIDRCPDQELLEEVKRVLIPIQRGETEPVSFFCPTMEEVDEYCARQEYANEGLDQLGFSG